MIPILGSQKRLCDGLSRRDLLQIGGLGAFGVGLGDILRWNDQQAEAGDRRPSNASRFGSAKACVLIFLYGSPPQHETFDPKPLAPAQIQGEFKAIQTSIPGVEFGELLPQTSQIANRCTIVRSLTHPYPLHGFAYAVTGMPTYTPSVEFSPRDPMQWPYIGSIVNYVDGKQPGQKAREIPANLALPWQAGSKCDRGPLAGPYASFLGQGHDPICTDFQGDGTVVVPKLADNQTKAIRDPFGGVLPSGRFMLAADAELQKDVSRGRFDHRRLLLRQFDAARARIQSTEVEKNYDRHQQRAISLLSSNRVRDALDIQREKSTVRESYGMTLFGQSLLAARRLVEAGGRFISVFWDPYDTFAGSCWDTHSNHFPRLKDYLLPVFDRAFSGFIRDLEERGLLDETLVLCLSEHGRTPQIDNKPIGGGRHHWSRVYSTIMAGGGAGRGNVVGRSDAIGGDVAAQPVSPKDMLATSFHLLGIDPHHLMPDQNGRPLPIAGDGIVRHELFGS